MFGVRAFDGGAYGDFYGWGGCGGDFFDLGDFGGADVGVGDARNVLVDGGRGASGCGAHPGCGREVGFGAGEGAAEADEFADEIAGGKEAGRQGKTKSENCKAFTAETQSSLRKEEEDKAEKHRSGLDLPVTGT